MKFYTDEQLVQLLATIPPDQKITCRKPFEHETPRYNGLPGIYPTCTLHYERRKTMLLGEPPIVINGIELPICAKYSQTPDLYTAFNFYTKNIDKPWHKKLGTIPEYLENVYNEMKKGEDSSMSTKTFGEALKALQRYAFTDINELAKEIEEREKLKGGK